MSPPIDTGCFAGVAARPPTAGSAPTTSPLGCADRIWSRIGAPLFGMRHLIRHHERCLDGVRRNLGEEAFDAEFRSGSHLSRDQAITFALEERTSQSAHRVDAASTGGLTPRELEVAGLIAEGMSNKSIAAKLVISQRTAEAHVEHIFGKLGFSSRTQVAAWVTEVRAADAETPSTTDRGDT
jgi:DNA-binding CsgD family transcriptional regulator